jgi:uncharacterized membrane protein YphA (DoxX/SURF4 family)
MKKLKPNPDIAVLVLRLALAIGYLYIFSIGIKITSFSMLASSGVSGMIVPILALAIYSLGSLFLIIGLFTRSVSVIFILFILLIDVMSGTQVGQLIQTVFDIHLWALVAVCLIGAGKYSLDQKFFFREKTQAQQL